MRKYLLILLMLISCKDEKFDGKIIFKKYIPSHRYSYTTMQHCGKSLIPIHHIGNTDEKYIFILEIEDDIKIVYVKRYDYENFEIGNEYKNIK